MIDTSPLRRRLLDLAVTGRLTGGGAAAAESAECGVRRAECFSRVEHKEHREHAALPPGWRMVRLGEVAEIQLGKMLDRTKNLGKPFKYLANANVRWGVFDLTDLKETRFAADEVEKFSLYAGDLLMCEGGVPGRCAIWRENNSPIKYQKAIHRIRVQAGVLPEYLQIFFEAIHDKAEFSRKFTGSTIHHLPREVLVNLEIPLPPLAEQKEIVRRLEGMLARERGIAEDSAALDALVAAAKRKILQLAVSGKLGGSAECGVRRAGEVPSAECLVPGRAVRPRAAESAECGVRRAEGGNSAECGVRRAECFSRANGEKGEPFALPAGWQWCRGDRLFVETESRLPQGEYFDYIDIDAIDNKRHKVVAPKHLRVADAPSRASRGLKEGDVLFSIVRPYLENIALISSEHKDCIASTGFFVCRPSNLATSKFVYLLMTTPYVVSGLNAFMKGDNSPSIRKKDILNFKFPLPPIAEQEAIVAKVDALFAALDAIKG